MDDIVIQAVKIDKSFRIGTKQDSYRTLRDTLTNAFTEPFRRIGKLTRGQAYGAAGLDEEIWALKNVSFEIKRGEVVGFIGRNGAGKSTLLKILSRITEPTSGYAEIRGRVGSLLEVGTGFHPELTGRENIFLNGAILGMKRAEIIRKFDEIVAFSEVEKFIDTPVKHYSSGMYLRLAFAVAAHLEPEILIVDEVLAVGDARFQQKCLNKMEDVGKEGRTVLFVSHNMSAVARLCQRAVLLESGGVINDGPSQKIVSEYLNSDISTSAMRSWDDVTKAPGNDVVRLRSVRVRNKEGQIADTIDISEPICIDIEYVVFQSDQVFIPYSDIYDENGVLVFNTFDLDPTWRRKPRPTGRYVSTFQIPGNFLSEGRLFAHIAIWTFTPSFHDYFYEKHAVGFTVLDSYDGTTARGDYKGKLRGVVRPLLNWSTQFYPSREDLPDPIRRTKTN
jgi:lipopolysaccharide transport system ATP-binding protein